MVNKEKYRGYTLIELLMVIAIISVLAAIAIPMYRAQTVKAKLAEVTNSMSHVASAVGSYYGDMNDFPSSLDIPAIQSSLGVGLSALSAVGTASVTNGVISVTIANVGGAVNGATLILSPSTASDGSVKWAWGGTIKAAYLPKQ